MIVIKKTELPASGKLVCIYGESGTGKTVSTLQTAPDPILWIVTEPRDLKEPVEAADRPDLDLDIAPYSGWAELVEFLSDDKNVERYKTVFLDSLTYLMTISLGEEVSNEAFEARTEKERVSKPIASQTKLTIENRGVVNNCIFRTLKSLGRLAQSGKLVVVSCLLFENPKYDRDLAAGPALSGREVPTSFPAFFDLIGIVKPRLNDQGENLYPPLVIFESDGSFLAKYTGKGKKRRGPLNFKKILGVK